MYTVQDKPGSWSTNPIQHVYCGQMSFPTYMMGTGLSNTGEPMPLCYSVQTPTWYPSVTTKSTSERFRLPSDDVFLPNTPLANNTFAFNDNIQRNSLTRPLSPSNTEKSDDFDSELSSLSGDAFSESSNSINFGTGTVSPVGGYNASNMSYLSSNRSSPISNMYDDEAFSSFVPFERAKSSEFNPSIFPVKPLEVNDSFEDFNYPSKISDVMQDVNYRGRKITSGSSEKMCPRFSQNGLTEDLDNCDKIILARQETVVHSQAKKREDFLLILQAERERQRKLVLPKYTPKMICKFCKNNGESPEVYTKHRLHYNEKTICPLLRHYICRLCNSTGDFAHTIRHCPFNNKKDKIAWRATFLV